LIRQSKELATLRTNVDIELDLEQLRLQTPDRAAAYQLFRELEFQALTREFADAASSIGGVRAGTQTLRYRIIRKRAELESLVRGLWEAEHWGFAINDSSPVGAGQQASTRDVNAATGISISTAPGASAYVDLENFEDGADVAITLCATCWPMDCSRNPCMI
jgi:DNA polymerase-1